MKNLLLATTIAIATSSAAVADVVRARITHVEPRYETVYNNVPTTQCRDVEVPVYGNTGGGATGGDVLGGMIIGGLLGSQRNKQNSQQIVGYRQEQRCSTSYTAQTEQVLGYTQIVVDAGGYKVTANTKREVKVGDVVNVGVALTVQ